MSTNDSKGRKVSAVFTLDKGARLLLKSWLAIEKDIEKSSKNRSPVTNGFSQILEAYEKYMFLTCTPDDLLYRVYPLYWEDVVATKNVNPSFYDLMTLNMRDIVGIVEAYFLLPIEERFRAEARSNKLIEILPGSDKLAHETVWNSKRPVSEISCNNNPKTCSRASYWEILAYEKGHDLSLHKICGKYPLMLLSHNELQEAFSLFECLNPKADLKEMNKIAKLKYNFMTAKIYLELLRQGYASVEQIKAAGNIVGASIRKASYFDLILAGGTGLAKEAKNSLIATVA